MKGKDLSDSEPPEGDLWFDYVDHVLIFLVFIFIFGELRGVWVSLLCLSGHVVRSLCFWSMKIRVGGWECRRVKIPRFVVGISFSLSFVRRRRQKNE